MSVNPGPFDPLNAPRRGSPKPNAPKPPPPPQDPSVAATNKATADATTAASSGVNNVHTQQQHRMKQQAAKINGMNVVPRQLGIAGFKIEQIASFYSAASQAVDQTTLQPLDLGIIGQLAHAPDDFNNAMGDFSEKLGKFAKTLNQLADALNQAAKHYAAKDDENYDRFKHITGDPEWNHLSSTDGYAW